MEDFAVHTMLSFLPGLPLGLSGYNARGKNRELHRRNGKARTDEKGYKEESSYKQHTKMTIRPPALLQQLLQPLNLLSRHLSHLRPPLLLCVFRRRRERPDSSRHCERGLALSEAFVGRGGGGGGGGRRSGGGDDLAEGEVEDFGVGKEGR